MLRIFLIAALSGCASTPATQQSTAESKFDRDIDQCTDDVRGSGKALAIDFGIRLNYLVRDCMTLKGWQPGQAWKEGRP